MFCMKCGAENADGIKFCGNCGTSLTSGGGNDAPAAISESEYYERAVGPDNQDYYLSRFARFDETGKSRVGWHWPAFFLTFLWFLYRKMWIHALVYMVLPLVVLVVASLVTVFAAASNPVAAGMVMLIAMGVYLLGMLVVPPMYATSMYYNHCKSQIRSVKRLSRDTEKQLRVLAGRGGATIVVPIVVSLLLIIPIGGIAAAI